MLSVSQLSDKDYKVIFDSDTCSIIDNFSDSIKFTRFRKENIYVIDLEKLDNQNESCLAAISKNNSWLWHRRLEHASMDTLSKLIRKDIIKGLPKLKYKKDRLVVRLIFR